MLTTGVRTRYTESLALVLLFVCILCASRVAVLSKRAYTSAPRTHTQHEMLDDAALAWVALAGVIVACGAFVLGCATHAALVLARDEQLLATANRAHVAMPS